MSLFGRSRRKKAPLPLTPEEIRAWLMSVPDPTPEPARAAGRGAGASSPPRRQRRRQARRLALVLVLVAVLVALAASAVVFAYFTGYGTGSGTAAAGTVQAVTLSPGTTETATSVYPGGSGDAYLTVDNPNGIAVRIASLTLDSSLGTNGFSVDASHSGCNTSVLSFGSDGTDSTGWTVPAHANAFPIDLVDDLHMSSAAADACQGASFTVYLKAGS